MLLEILNALSPSELRMKVLQKKLKNLAEYFSFNFSLEMLNWRNTSERQDLARFATWIDD